MAFKDNLRSRREELGMTQLELAKAAGITTRTIYNYESGERRPSNIEVVQRIANALGSTTGGASQQRRDACSRGARARRCNGCEGH